MKTRFMTLCVAAGVLALGSAAQALTTIGTATYNGSAYNLIWDDDNNGNSLVWLDYSNSQAHWGDQMTWAAGLGSFLTYNIDSSYTVTWSDASWRLPSAGSDPVYGCQAATQEMGHLYYDELGFVGGFNVDGVTAPDLGSCMFDNLQLGGYWTHTEDPIDYGFFVLDAAWAFFTKINRSTPYDDIGYGFQDIDSNGSGWLSPLHYGIAVRGGEVTAASNGVIPEPVTMLGVLASIVGVGTYVRKRRIT